MRKGIAFLVLSIAVVPNISAGAIRAPNIKPAQALQPLPADIQPNLSGNVNSTYGYVPEVYEEDPVTEPVPVVTPSTEQPEKSQNFTYVFASLFLLVAYSAYRFYAKKAFNTYPS